jgi:zinc/manganese transport system ATP-binding protein
MNAIELRAVSLALGGRVVLADISLDIPAGQFIGVLGPNGSGKTTLMRAILGLLGPKSGTLRVLGAPATRGNPQIGYRPQTASSMPALAISGWDFVASVADGHRLGLPILSATARAQVQEALERVGAEKLAARPLGELSGGERQRLLLAQALIGNPKLLLLDEPLISLDPRRQQEVVELVKNVQRELAITVLFSAHELNPLLNAIDQVLYLGSGQAALGPVEAVITAPVLSKLYGSPIDVFHVQGRIFVMSGIHDVEADAHRHEHGPTHGHAHDDHSHDDHSHGAPAHEESSHV